MSTPLRQLLADILFDDAARADFGADSEALLEQHGWSTLEGTELQEAVTVLGDGLPVETALAIESAVEAVDFSHASLAEMGAELAEAVGEANLEIPAEPSESGADSQLDFGTGAEPQTSLDEQVVHDDTSGLDRDEALDTQTVLEADANEVVFEDNSEGIDIDEPLVHDIEDIDAIEIEFDLNEPGIDDLDI